MTTPDPASSIPLLSGSALAQRVTPVAAVESLEGFLLEGLDIESDPPRLFSPLRAGEFLLMPSETPAYAGIKVATIAPENVSRGLPRIHAWYLLFDAPTLRPLAIVDGTRLTLIRTAAVTAFAVRGLLAASAQRPSGRIGHLAVVGSGPQAEAHIRTLCALLPVERVTIVGRTASRTADRVAALADLTTPVGAGERSTLPTADVVITVTSSHRAVIGREDVADDAVIAAVGAHGAGNRELDSDLVLDGDLLVEARASALRENGNLLLARSAEQWMTQHPLPANLADLAAGRVTRRAAHPAVYTGVGMSWEDLAVVARIFGDDRPAG